MFDTLPQALALVRLADDCLLDANPALLAQLGRRLEEVQGQRADALGLPSPQALLAATGKGSIERCLADPSGHDRWTQWSAHALAPHGPRGLALLVGTEITARQREEQDLRRSERSFFSLFDAAPLPMSYSPLQPGLSIGFWNQAWYQTFGYAPGSKEGLGGNRFGFWRKPAEREHYVEALMRSPAVLECEVQLRHADGSVRDCLLSGRYVEIGGGRGVLTSYRDITVMKGITAELRASEQRFRQLFDVSPVALALAGTGANGRILATNRQWIELLGYEREDMPDIEHWWRLAFPDTDARAVARARWRAHFTQAARIGGLMPPLPFQVRTKQGRELTLLISSALVGREVLASFQDITELRQAQHSLNELNQNLEARVKTRTQELVRSEKLAALGSLVAGVAHELNTPIGNALLMASTLADQRHALEQALQAGLRKSQLQQFLAELEASGTVLIHSLERASQLISSFKQVAVSQSDYQRRAFPLAAVVHETALTLLPTLRPRGIELAEQVDAQLQMDSYPGPLVQVLISLVTNAALHGFPAGAPGRISIEAEADGEQALCLRVRDNGVGMPAVHLERAFDPFFTTKLGQGGSGLGLHIAYNLVTGLLGGRIELSSTPGQGLSVELRLPRCAPPQAAPG